MADQGTTDTYDYTIPSLNSVEADGVRSQNIFWLTNFALPVDLGIADTVDYAISGVYQQVVDALQVQLDASNGAKFVWGS